MLHLGTFLALIRHKGFGKPGVAMLSRNPVELSSLPPLKSLNFALRMVSQKRSCDTDFGFVVMQIYTKATPQRGVISSDPCTIASRFLGTASQHAAETTLLVVRQAASKLTA